jgi:hypothetical protein
MVGYIKEMIYRKAYVLVTHNCLFVLCFMFFVWSMRINISKGETTVTLRRLLRVRKKDTWLPSYDCNPLYENLHMTQIKK